jgi:hypothetical protein
MNSKISDIYKPFVAPFVQTLTEEVLAPLAFIFSVSASAVLLCLFSYVEPFSVSYVLTICLRRWTLTCTSTLSCWRSVTSFISDIYGWFGGEETWRKTRRTHEDLCILWPSPWPSDSRVRVKSTGRSMIFTILLQHFPTSHHDHDFTYESRLISSYRLKPLKPHCSQASCKSKDWSWYRMIDLYTTNLTHAYIMTRMPTSDLYNNIHS